MIRETKSGLGTYIRMVVLYCLLFLFMYHVHFFGRKLKKINTWVLSNSHAEAVSGILYVPYIECCVALDS